MKQTNANQTVATLLINTFKTPCKALEFFTTILQWVHNFETNHAQTIGRNNSEHLAILIHIEQIVLPWMQNPKNAKQSLSKAYDELTGTFGSEGYLSMMSRITESYSFACKDIGTPSMETINLYHSGIEALDKIGYYISTNKIVEIAA